MDAVRHGDGSTLRYVSAGDFLMGTRHEDAAELVRRYGWRPYRFGDEGPAHPVYLDAFFIAEFPVTVGQYARFLADTGAPVPDCWDDPRFTEPNQPVIGVDRHQAIAYAAWVGLRLPTEAEWEKAARGTDGRIWPWGNDWDPARANTAERGTGRPVQIGQHAAAGNVSPYGVAEMVGNVWEWCLDRYDAEYYRDSPRENPRCTKPEVHYDGYYVVRGGSWLNRGDRVRCASRYDRFAQQGRRHIGFRCALDA